MYFVEPNIVVWHVGFWHWPLVHLFMPKREYGHSISETPIDVYQVECLELFPSFFFLCCSWQPLLDEKGGALGKVLWVVVAKWAEEESPATTRTVGVACTSFLCSRSCHNCLFLSFTFRLISWSSRSVCKYIIIIIGVIGSGWKSLLRFIRAMRRVRAVSCEGWLSFFGACGTLLSFFFSSSMSASPNGRVWNWDRYKELELLS